jgi:hypothetical protein
MLSVRSSSKIIAVLFSSCSLLPETSPQSEILETELAHAWSVRSSSKLLRVFSSCIFTARTSPQSEILEAELEHARMLRVLDLVARRSQCLALAFYCQKLRLKNEILEAEMKHAAHRRIEHPLLILSLSLSSIAVSRFKHAGFTVISCKERI